MEKRREERKSESDASNGSVVYMTFAVIQTKYELLLMGGWVWDCWCISRMNHRILHLDIFSSGNRRVWLAHFASPHLGFVLHIYTSNSQ